MVSSDGELAEELVKLGVRCTVVLFPSALSQLGDASSRYRRGRMRVTARAVVAVPSIFRYAFRVRQLLVRYRPDVVAEAMATGRPVIVSPLGGAAEIVAEGSFALCAEPGDSTALALQITRLALDASLRQSMGDPATQLDKFYSFFEEVAKARTDARRVGT